MKYLIILLLASIVFFGCGEGKVDLTSVSYEPKIVVEAYLYPGLPVRDIRINRNFPINRSINDSLTLSSRRASVYINGTQLSYNQSNGTFYSNSIIVEKGKTYNLLVKASFDGNTLQTTGSTTVPSDDFRLLTPGKDLGTITYGSDISFRFIPSSSVDFYAYSISPDSASVYNFIFDNLYFPNIKMQDLIQDFNSYKYQEEFLLNASTNPADTVTQIIYGFDTWFYSSYKIIIYEGDINFKDYVLGGKNVQEFDGNFHYPKEHLTGDGIGVFGSAFVDTLKFNLIKQ